jgi:hypothetical protein
MNQQQLFDLILDENQFNKLSEIEVEILEKILLSNDFLPEEIKELFLDLSNETLNVKQNDTYYLDDEIDNVIHPRDEFVPNPPNLNMVHPEYISQFQQWVLDNDVVLNERYLPEDGEKELDQKQKYESQLIDQITDIKQKIIPSKLRKIISEIDCNNLIDPITLEEVTKKNYLELKWIIVLNESGKVGDCYNKEELIQSMHANKTFAPFPEREHIFYKMPNGIWIDEIGLKQIPKSKIVQLKYIGDKKIGTRFGISRTHGYNEKIYTLNKIF